MIKEKVAASLSLMGIGCLAAGAEKVFKIGGVTIHSIVANKAGMATDQMISAISVWLIVIVAEAVLVCRYVAELEQGKAVERDTYEK